MKLIISILLIGAITLPCFSQSLPNNAFQAGETLKFKGSYFMSSLWADLAEVNIVVSDYKTEGRSLYSIQATASTYSNYDSFFKIRDLYQSWIDKTDLKPYIFKRVVDEGGYQFNMKYVIKRATLQAKYDYERKGITKSSVINITEDTHDLVSVLYYLRTLDYDKMSFNKVISISVLIDDKVENLNLTFKGKETIKTDVFGSKSCYKLGIAINNKALVNKETNNIWFTADKNRIPVLVKAEIPVGSIQLRLSEVKGLK